MEFVGKTYRAITLVTRVNANTEGQPDQDAASLMIVG